MLKSDLKQIKQVIDESIEQNNTSIKQVIDESIEQNNTSIKQVIDESINNLAKITNENFIELENKIDEVSLDLKEKITKEDLNDWKFDQNFEKDIKALKYVNINKLKNLPSVAEINNTLIKEVIK